MDIYPVKAHHPDDPWRRKVMVFSKRHGLWALWALIELTKASSTETYRDMLISILVTTVTWFGVCLFLYLATPLPLMLLVPAAMLGYLVGGIRYRGLQENWP